MISGREVRGATSPASSTAAASGARWEPRDCQDPKVVKGAPNKGPILIVYYGILKSGILQYGIAPHSFW